MLTKFTSKVAYATLLLGMLHTAASAQLRPYTLAYSENIKGGSTMFGNTILHIIENNTVNLTKMNETSNAANGVGLGNSNFGNDQSNMQFIDVDGVATTANSSTADLVLPAGTNTIKFARLYWGGRINTATITGAPDTLRKVKIRKGTTGAYLNALAAAGNVNTIDIVAGASGSRVYQSFVDITSFVNSNGGGTYTIADIPVTTGSVSGGGQYGGWSIVVAYENQTQPYNSVRIYDGYAQVFNSGSSTTLDITLSGLNVPNNPLAANEAVMSTMAWEGDANLFGSGVNAGDFIKINSLAVSNAMNPVTNFWNGSITKNGVNVTTKNPNYSNQMGIDIDEVNVGTGFNILPNATSVTIQFGTEQDQYFPSVFSFYIRMKDPLVTMDKAVSDADGNGFVNSNEILTYTLSGVNSGVGSAYNTFVIDSLPTNVTYVAGSLEVVNAPGVTAGFKSDNQDADAAFKGVNPNNNRNYVKFFIGTGATGAAGGELAAGATYTLRFKVKAAVIPGTVINTARITSSSQAGDVFTDDGTAVIGADAGPVPVKFTSFKATLVNQNGLVEWATEAEINNDHFEVERSEDGIHFVLRGKVAGNGSSSTSHKYSYTDPINTSAAIVYYRLRIVDTDGKYSFSKIVAVKLNGSAFSDKISVFPNPFTSNIKVSFAATTEEDANFRIIGLDGRVVITRKMTIQKGDNIVVMHDLGNLPRGSYILEVVTSTDKFIQKIIKQ
ncbi:MAG TPA: T9SS type A sorting domain-containing protein [Ferruginibacter sp.]|nr:T9SS type A sorting domain-containing protein [Ferruginibacter sp.]